MKPPYGPFVKKGKARVPTIGAHLAGTANQRKRMAEGDARHNPQ